VGGFRGARGTPALAGERFRRRPDPYFGEAAGKGGDQAIGTDQDRKFVLILKSDNTVEYRPVVTGRVVDGLRVVESGLTPNERVVVNGLMRVRPGMKVTAKNDTVVAQAAAPAPAAR